MIKKLKCPTLFMNSFLQKIKYLSFFRTILKVKVSYYLIKESMPPLSGLACTTDG